MTILEARATLLFACAVAALAPAHAAEAPLTNAFYAMDTCTKRPYPKNDIPPAAQFDLLKELGYAGVAWTEEPPQQVADALRQAEARGLKMFAIYCAATATPEGTLSTSAQVKPILDALKGHDTLLWLHIGGRGPAFDTLKGDEPLFGTLRALADAAAANGLRVALYPHVGEWTERIQNAVTVAKLVDRRNFGVTFNLCHCLAMGDEARIPELLAQAAPLLFTVTVNGADSGVSGANWSRLIQTLDHGSYDVSSVLRKLRELGFGGPIGLQGYAIGGDRRDNLARSLEAWKKLSAAAAAH